MAHRHQPNLLLAGVPDVQLYGHRATEHYAQHQSNFFDFSHIVPHIEPLQRSKDIFLRPISEYDTPADTEDISGVADYFIPPFDPPNLPIARYRDSILATVKDNMVTVVTAPTGSGKSTQVPQYILDDEFRNEGRHCKIAVTQPRRVAAMSLASRVLKERNLPPIPMDEDNTTGSLVGYQVGMDRRVNVDTRLIYMTTGVLLRKVITNGSLQEFTHIILDEVHERSTDIDFLLLMIKKLMSARCHYVKIIIMSATVDAAKFSEYFMTHDYDGICRMAPVIEVKEAMFKVDEFYLDDMPRFIGRTSSVAGSDRGNGADINDKVYAIASDLICNLKRRRFFNEQGKPGAVLVFLPGIYEIEHLQQVLQSSPARDEYDILVLHSTIPRDAQLRVFNEPRSGRQKVILSTNIAESSITVPDVKYVIDFCLTKELHADHGSGLSCLRYNWAAKSSLDQRRGRAGRVSKGYCFRLIWQSQLHEIQDFSTPEMQRCSVEQLILYCKKLDLGDDPESLLSQALDPPSITRLKDAAKLLLQTGGLALPQTPIADPLAQDLTFLGRAMSTLPLDVRLTRLVLFGLVFNCLDEAVVMAACLSLPAFLETPYQNKEEKLKCYVNRMRKAKGTFSDPIMMLNLFTEWEKIFDKNPHEAVKFCQANYINCNRIKEVASLVRDLKNSIKMQNIPDMYDERLPYYQDEGENKRKTLMIKLALAASNYPNYFLMRKGNRHTDRSSCVKAFGDRSPTDTVMYSGFDGESGTEYTCIPQIQEYFTPDIFSTIKEVSCSGNRLFVTFNKPSGSIIDKSVYYALKCRSTRRHLKLRLGEDFGQLTTRFYDYELWDAHNVEVTITHFDSLHKFYGQLQDLNIRHDFENLEKRLNLRTLNPPRKSDIKLRSFGLAIFDSREQLYRVRIIRIHDNFKYTVQYVDYGNCETIKGNMIFEVDPEFLACPFQAVELCLDGVRPAPENFDQTTGHTWNQNFLRKMGDDLLNNRYRCRVICLRDHTYHVDLVDLGEGWSLQDYLLKFKSRYAKVQQDDITRSFESQGVYDMRTVKLEKVFFPEERPRETRRIHQCQLSGPTSPFEARYDSMTYTYRTFSCTMDPTSVNSITICEKPEEDFHELLTAMTVSLSNEGSSITLRGNTKHTYWRGLAQLIVLLFAPSIQLHTDCSRLHYVGCVAGIGMDDLMESLWPDHDLHIQFDVRLLSSDIREINQVRVLMSEIIRSDLNDPDKLFLTRGAIRSKQREISSRIMNLMERFKDREELLVRPNEMGMTEFQWQPSHATTNAQDTYGDDGDLLRPHDVLLMDYGPYQIEVESHEMKDRVDKLRCAMAQVDEKTTSHSGITLNCELCGRKFDRHRTLLSHLSTIEHIQEIRKLEHWRWTTTGSRGFSGT